MPALTPASGHTPLRGRSHLALRSPLTRTEQPESWTIFGTGRPSEMSVRWFRSGRTAWPGVTAWHGLWEDRRTPRLGPAASVTTRPVAHNGAGLTARGGACWHRTARGTERTAPKVLGVRSRRLRRGRRSSEPVLTAAERAAHPRRYSILGMVVGSGVLYCERLTRCLQPTGRVRRVSPPRSTTECASGLCAETVIFPRLGGGTWPRNRTAPRGRHAHPSGTGSQDRGAPRT
jgi:hypothetical protein